MEEDSLAMLEQQPPDAVRAPILTVILPVFNAWPYLTAAVESILEGMDARMRLVIIDDGSSDRSKTYLASLVHPLVEIRRQENIGLAATLDTAIRSCVTPFVARMDHDDINGVDRLPKALDLLVADDGIVLVSSWARVVDETGTTVGCMNFPWLEPDVSNTATHIANNVVHGSAVIRKSAYCQAGGYRNVDAEDYDLWLRMRRHGRQVILPDECYAYRRLTTSMTGTGGSRYEDAANAMRLESWKAAPPWGLVGPSIVRRSLIYRRASQSCADFHWRALVHSGQQARHCGYRGFALLAYLAAVTLYPGKSLARIARRMRAGSVP